MQQALVAVLDGSSPFFQPRRIEKFERSRTTLLHVLLASLVLCGSPVLKVAAQVSAPTADGAPQATREATQHNAAGLAKARSRDYAAAIVEFTEAIRLDPTFAEAFRNRAVAEESQGQLDEALRDFSQAVALNPRFTQAFNSRGLLYARRKDYPHAIADYSQALTIDPTFMAALGNRARVKRELRDFDGAVADLTAALALEPKMARLYDDRAAVKLAKQDFDGAIADYDAALALAPKNVSTLVRRGTVKMAKKTYPEAIADFTSAIELDPQNAFAYYERGVAHLDLGQHGDAIADLTRTIEIDPSNANAFLARCQAHHEKKESPAALSDCNRAVALAPTNVRAYLMRGEARADQDVAGAARDFSEAIRLDGANSRAYYDRCRMAVRKSEFEHAIADCTDAIRLNATFAEAYYQRALAFDKHHDPARADADYAKAQALNTRLVRPATEVAATRSSVPPDPPAPLDGVYRPGAGVATPKLLREVKPKYTARAFQERIHGAVLLEAVVGIDGRISDVTVRRSLDAVHGLDDQALTAVREWAFEPGTKDGKPVPVLITIEMSFTLDDSVPPLSLPDAFIARARPAGANDLWQQQTFDQSAVMAHMTYPKEWSTTTGLPGGLIAVQSTATPIGVVLIPPGPAPGAIDSPLPVSVLRAMADTVAKNSGRSIAKFGQASVNGQWWFWMDLGWMKPSDIQAASPMSAMAKAIEQTHGWLFMTVAEKQLCGALFLVNRLQGVSAVDAERLINDAGPVFADMLEHLSFTGR